MNPEHQLAPIEGSSIDLMDMSGFGPPASSSAEQSPLKKLHSILRGRYGWAIGLGAVLALIGATLGWLIPEPMYTSTGSIRIVPVLQPVLSDPGGTQNHFYESAINTEVNNIGHSRVIEMVMEHDGYRRLGRPTDLDAKADIYRHLTVTHPPQTELILVSFEDRDPQAAQVITQAILDSYMEVRGDNMRDERIRLLQDELTRARRAQQDARDKLKLAANEYGTEDLSALYDVAAKEQARRNIELSEVQAALVLARAAQGEPKDAPGEAPAPAPAPAPVPPDGAAAAPANGDDNPEPAPAAPQPALAQQQPAESPMAKDAADFDESRIAMQDLQFRTMLNQRDALQRQLKTMQLTLGENHREVVAGRLTLQNMQREIDQYASDFRRNWAAGFIDDGQPGAPLPQTVTQLEQRLQAAKGLYDASVAETTKIGNARLNLERLKDDLEAADRDVEQIEDRIAQLNLEDVQRTKVYIADAQEPLEPSRDRRKLAAVAGIMFGGGMGVGLVMLVGLFDRRLRSVEDATESFGTVPVLGVLPRLPKDLSDPEHAAMTSHAVHQVRSLLQIGPSAEGRRVFAVTSPGPGDGKTSLALALGVSFAASGAQTLLVDCDMFGGPDSLTGRINTIIRRKIGQVLLREQLVTQQQVDQALRLAQESNRRLGETLIELGYLTQDDLDQALGLQEHAPIGLLDALQGEQIEHCIADTGIDHLSVLPIGAANPGDVCKISPSLIGRLLDDARKLYDVVIVDTGPVPGSLEAAHVAAEADGVVMVVSRGEQRHMAARALAYLASVNARIAGLVFNRAEAHDIGQLSESQGFERSGWRPSTTPTQESERFGPVARAVAASAATPGRNGNGKV